MSKLLENAMSEAGWDQKPRNTTAGRLSSEAQGVGSGPEFLRVRSLQRRQWQSDPALPQLVELLSRKMKVENPAHPDMQLFPAQAAALKEFFDEGRLFMVADVGVGKTLTSFLLPALQPHKRPLLLTYAKLIDKTHREFAELGRTWKTAERWEILGYEKLSRDDKKLRAYAPDLIIADEGHALGSPKSGRVRKLMRYLQENPACKLILLTATPGDKSISQFSHLMHACLGAAHAPVPAPGSWEHVCWAQALDYDVMQRRAPGCLALFNDKAVSLNDIREGVGRRIEETPGALYNRVSDVACSLYLDAVVLDAPSEIMEFVRESGDQLPDGRILDTPMEKYQLFSTLGLGFARFFETPPPDAWRSARRLWTAFTQEIMDQEHLALDTPGAVALACENGSIDSHGVYSEWKAIKPTFKPVTKSDWFDTHALEAIAAWADANEGLVWIPFPELGRKLSAMTGRPFFHELGRDAAGLAIEEYAGSGSVLASTGANATGRNLQRWSNMLIIGSGSSSSRLHQQIGRCHRQGQTAEAVNVSFFISSSEDLEAVHKARGRAVYDQTAGQNRAHKLLIADFLLPEKINLDSPRFGS